MFGSFRNCAGESVLDCLQACPELVKSREWSISEKSFTLVLEVDRTAAVSDFQANNDTRYGHLRSQRPPDSVSLSLCSPKPQCR